MQAYKKLEKQQIMAHLKGASEDAADVIGIYPLLKDGTCRFIVFDFDNHEKTLRSTILPIRTIFGGKK